MANIQEVESAFMKAHKAGDTKNAQILATHLRSLLGQKQSISGGVSNTPQQTIPSNQATPTINDSGGLDISISRSPEPMTTRPLMGSNLQDHSKIKRIVTDR